MACGASLLCSLPLWLADRSYPLQPIASWFPVLPPRWDVGGLVLMLAALVAALRFPRAGVAGFLAVSLFLALGDQARWQPWFYMYWVMMLLTLAGGRTGIMACRIALCAVYLWAGVQKLNPNFFHQVSPWFVQPAAAWLPAIVMRGLGWLVAAAPAAEIFMAIALWPRRTRRAALWLCAALHGISLVFLGPLGHNLNSVIWPWNLAMPTLAFVLFPLRPEPRREDAEAGPGRRSAWAYGIAGLFALLPALSFLGWWDSYLSFALYSGNTTTADLYLSAAVRERLPEAVRKYAAPTPEPFNPELQGAYVLRVDLWALHTLNVLPLPERRTYLHLARYVAGFASDPSDVRLVVVPRGGGTLFYRGGDLRPSAGVPLNF
ncbi:MAG TPA: hypothetical protein VNH84_08045 [Candidatus Saccharimonadales bacterium]|nr:hypothetical protein [Candidatus Saccharimonadales bacterium]